MCHGTLKSVPRLLGRPVLCLECTASNGHAPADRLYPVSTTAVFSGRYPPPPVTTERPARGAWVPRSNVGRPDVIPNSVRPGAVGRPDFVPFCLGTGRTASETHV